MKLLDLFSGIGGFSIGLEAAGMQTIAFCEREPFCQAVLKKHWPELPCHDDVTTLNGSQYAGQIDVIAGGFPCQDISVAGKGKGLAGERSGLWSQFLRLIKEIKPRYAIIENVSALRSRGLEEVLRSLDEIGYDAEWHCITASAIGAPHRRDRIWIVAYARSAGWDAGDVCQQRNNGKQIKSRRPAIASQSSQASAPVANALREGLEGQWTLTSRIGTELKDTRYSRGWLLEPNVGRVANGVPARVDRIKALGNSIVPQIAEIIGKSIMEVEYGHA